MNIIMLINLSVLLCSGLFAYQAVIDLIDSRKLSRYKSVRKNKSLQKITAVIQFNGNCDEFIQQVDSLKEQAYGNLEIVVLVGSKYSAELKYILHSVYKGIIETKAVGYERNQSLKKTIDRYCSGSLIILINHNDKLSKSFFEFINLEADFKPRQMIFYPAHQFRIDNSVLSLLFAQAEMFRRFWMDVVGIKINLSRIHSGVVYRHKIIETSGHIRVPINRLVFISRKSALPGMFEYLDYRIFNIERKLRRLSYILFYLVSIILLITIMITIGPRAGATLMIFSIIAYFIINAFMQVRLKGYLILERLNLILIVPIVLIIDGLVLILGLTSRLVNLSNKCIK